MLFLDVDGVLALKGSAPGGYAEHELLSSAGDLHTVWLSPEHGPWIRTLANSFDVVWATGWEHDAPRLLGPLLDLPRFAVVEFTERPAFGTRLSKLPDVAAMAGERSAGWVDDDFEEAARAWADRRQDPTLLIQPDPARGLEQQHVETLLHFSEELKSGNA